MSLCINPRCSQPQNSDDALFCQACGSELLLQGRYRISLAIGSGGFGKTYELSGDDKPKILKVLIHSSPKAVELFQREAKVLGQINHSGVPKVEGDFVFHAKGDPEPIYCMILEKVPGINLRQYMEQRDFRPIDEAAAKKWLLELAEILDVIHSQDLLHRDIKPSNIMLKPNGRLALIDFGAVKEGDTAGDGTEAATGTGGTETATRGTSIYSAAYAPQEQILGHAIKQSDIFSLGRTMIFLLTGKEPNAKDMYNPLEDRLEWQRFSLPVSNEFASLIDKMNARSPRERPDSFQKILNHVTNSYSTPTSPTTTIKPPQSASKLHETSTSSQSRVNAKMIWGFGGGLFTLIIGMIIYSSVSSNRIPIAPESNNVPVSTEDITNESVNTMPEPVPEPEPLPVPEPEPEPLPEPVTRTYSVSI